jgi:transcriptional regulator with XRE-family HTH domain
MMHAQPSTFGPLLRRWRSSRRLTQEQLADDAEVSTRHLSCLESGKAQPSREMVLVLASALELELRDRNVLLGAAGFAPVYRASPLEAAAMAPLRSAIELLLQKQEPYGAIVVDRAWNVLQWNDGARRLFARFMPRMPQDPRVATNVVHGLFSPEGLRPSIVNWEQVAAFTIERMHREIARHPEDPEGLALRDAILAYPGLPERFHATDVTASVDPFLAVHLRRGADEVRLFSTLTTLGTPLDVTAQELILESYFPADEASDRYLQALGRDVT